MRVCKNCGGSIKLVNSSGNLPQHWEHTHKVGIGTWSWCEPFVESDRRRAEPKVDATKEGE